MRRQLELCAEMEFESGYWQKLEWMGQHRRFLVARMGGTGSSFLARLLNSHIDVNCTHEDALKYMRASIGCVESIKCVYNWLASDSTHDAYKAAGDVGSAFLEHLIAARNVTVHSGAERPLPLATGLIVRHPLLVYRVQKSYFDDAPFQLKDWQVARIARFWPDLSSTEMATDPCFLWNMTVWMEGCVSANNVDVLIRTSDFGDLETLSTIATKLTGLVYPESLLVAATSVRINAKFNADDEITKIFNELSDTQKKRYLDVIAEPAAHLGYSVD